MYIFKATYTNMDNGSERKCTIEVDENFVENEAECYVHAMYSAYSKKGYNENLDCVEFISC